FIDEIQDSLSAISSLRYFYEELPELHVIAAGSLLEFALQKIASFGVGRIRSLYMYPFSFNEFLRASGEDLLADMIQNDGSPTTPLSDAIHLKCKKLLMNFMYIGGMPEVVSTYLETGSFGECQDILEDITQSFYNDFAKYKEKVNVTVLKEVFAAVIEQTGGKFTYSKASNNTNYIQIKESVNLLEMAGLVYPVTHTSANGLPLAAEQNTKFRKYLIFDTGIYQRFLRLDIAKLLSPEYLEQVNKGVFAELFVGLEMIKSAPANIPLSLFYWTREKVGANAEIDYIAQIAENIVPVEVKANTKGSMQSMFQFLKEKKYPYGIRCSMENFGEFNNVKIYPLYSIGITNDLRIC
ncbi:MAG: ATP-binding protein, partial [Bacteroidales bacterium]|nr:ATP-binding protein [Bacteroidales bacterium]